MTITRFAPSPTGALHLGNIRTAVFNALIARQAGGRFLLRIDDTDQERSEERFVDGLKRDLTWLGLEWDETFRQSERLAKYEEAAQQLRDAGRLYPCWESASDLALMRRRLLAAKKPPVYDRAALKLSDEERAELMKSKAPHWRFKLDPGAVTWEDGMRGAQKIDASAVSDPVLIREDGQFLYTLCSVVDDARTGITDVVRGADHVTNTATQIQIFRALGAEPPRFAHHSLMTGPGGEKISKRLGGLSIAELREAGAEPGAIISWLARIGSSRPVEPARSIEEAAAGFDVASFSLSPVRALSEEIFQLSSRMLHETDYADISARLPAEVTGPLWLAIRPNLETLADVEGWLEVTRGAKPAIAPEDEDFVKEALALLPAEPWDEGSWKAWTSAVKEATGRRGRGLFLPLRRALTGRDHGPDMSAFMPFLKRP